MSQLQKHIHFEDVRPELKQFAVEVEKLSRETHELPAKIKDLTLHTLGVLGELSLSVQDEDYINTIESAVTLGMLASKLRSQAFNLVEE